MEVSQSYTTECKDTCSKTGMQAWCKSDQEKKQKDMGWPADSFYLARRAKAVIWDLERNCFEQRHSLHQTVSLIIKVFMSTL